MEGNMRAPEFLTASEMAYLLVSGPALAQSGEAPTAPVQQPASEGHRIAPILIGAVIGIAAAARRTRQRKPK
jgi:hypothetical protein